jgi:hypothetical protein
MTIHKVFKNDSIETLCGAMPSHTSIDNCIITCRKCKQLLKFVVYIEDVKRLKKELMKINKIDLNKMILIKQGIKVEFTQKEINDFKFTGLNNTDFIL